MVEIKWELSSYYRSGSVTACDISWVVSPRWQPYMPMWYIVRVWAMHMTHTTAFPDLSSCGLVLEQSLLSSAWLVVLFLVLAVLWCSFGLWLAPVSIRQQLLATTRIVCSPSQRVLKNCDTICFSFCFRHATKSAGGLGREVNEFRL